MARLRQFSEHRWVGDKRSQICHDTDNCSDAATLDELAESAQFACFGPDELAEARNRGYRACTACSGVRAGSD